MSKFKIIVCFDNEQTLHFEPMLHLPCYLLVIKLLRAAGSSKAKAKACAKYLCNPSRSRTALLDDIVINVTRIDSKIKSVAKVFSTHP